METGARRGGKFYVKRTCTELCFLKDCCFIELVLSFSRVDADVLASVDFSCH